MIYCWSEAGVKLTSEAGVKLTLETAFDTELGGKFVMLVSVAAEIGGRHRLADDTLTAYELYKGQDAMPDYAAAPWETFTSSPHLTAALSLPPSGNRTYYFVLRRHNAHDLQSQNYYGEPQASDASWTVTIDSAGAVVTVSPMSPTDVAIEPAAAGAVRITASYNYTGDGTNAADTWLIYLTSNGVDPDPAVDTPVEVTMTLSGALANLDYTSSVYADGLTIKTLVRARRSGTPDVDSPNVDIHSTTSDTDGPAAPAGGIFYAKTAEAHDLP